MNNENQKSSFLSKFINGIFIIFIIIGLYFILSKSDWSRLDYVKDHVNYWLLTLVWFITILSMVLMIVRWYYLIKPIKQEISLRNIFRVSINAFAVNFATPGKMGVPAKAILLKKLENIEFSRSIPSLLGELFLEYFVMAIFLLVSVIVGGYGEKVYTLLQDYFFIGNIKGLIILGLVVVLVLLLFRKKIVTSNFFVQLNNAFKLTKSRKELLLLCVLISIVNLAITFFADMMLYRCLGFDIPYTFVIFAGGFANITGLLSPLPGGLGVREISSGYLYTVFYDIGEIAIAAVLIRRLMTYSSLIILFLLERLAEYYLKNKSLRNRYVESQNFISNNL